MHAESASSNMRNLLTDIPANTKGRSAMRLTPEQLHQFERDGYLFFPALFKPSI
jgi:hypothetical protein